MPSNYITVAIFGSTSLSNAGIFQNGNPIGYINGYNRLSLSELDSLASTKIPIRLTHRVHPTGWIESHSGSPQPQQQLSPELQNSLHTHLFIFSCEFLFHEYLSQILYFLSSSCTSMSRHRSSTSSSKILSPYTAFNEGQSMVRYRTKTQDSKHRETAATCRAPKMPRSKK